jgi:ACT domain-containing protein
LPIFDCQLPIDISNPANGNAQSTIDNRQSTIDNRQSTIGNRKSKIPYMANEDLIYRITRAVYERLGTSADEQMVEQLVTDIYREVNQSHPVQTGASPSGTSDRLVISVFGMDHPGIVAGVSQILAEASCSIVDINQTVVQGKFAMVIIADASRARESTTELKERLRREGEHLGVRIYAQREDLFNAMHRV